MSEYIDGGFLDEEIVVEAEAPDFTETEKPKKKKARKVKKQKSDETVQAEVVETEMVEETTVEKNGSTIEFIQQKIISLNDDADSITSAALSNATTSDLTQYQETLVAAIMAIQEATGENDTSSDEDGMLTGLWKKLGANFGLVKKVQKSVQEKFIENASLQENIDTIFESLEGSIVATEKDMNTLGDLQNSLSRSVELGGELVAELEVMISELGDSNDDLMEKAKLEGLLRELKSINLVNANTANQIKAQVTTTTGLAQNLREVRPILKNLIKSQTLVALQNARMGQAKEVRDLVSGVVNDFVTKNNENTQATILDAIEYSGKTVIHQETVAELGNQHDAFVKELGHIVKDLNKQKLEYNKTVDKVTKQLGDGLNQLPRLMAGDTTSTAAQIGHTETK
jgi:hypothetical protein